jgi:hypothetical protein
MPKHKGSIFLKKKKYGKLNRNIEAARFEIW